MNGRHDDSLLRRHGRQSARIVVGLMMCMSLATLSCARRSSSISDIADSCGCSHQEPPSALLALDVEPANDVEALGHSTPTEEGMDADLLEAGAATLAEYDKLYSVLVLRNDKIVLERYFGEENPTHARNIQSATKSFLSALVGIAIREGFIRSVDQTAAEFLPVLFSMVQDPRMLDITLRDLLTMTPGFAHDDPTKGESRNLLSGAISSTLVSEPGSAFNYNSISSHLVSAVLTEATGLSTCEFACRFLFEPIGITVDNWSRDAQGIYVGGAALYLTPRELARFGLLYLHEGVWAGRQVVPSEWVAESKAWHVHDTGSPDWGYGYYWWLVTIANHEAYLASGHGGQTILVVPDLDLVVVTTADSFVVAGEIDVVPFVENHVIPSIHDAASP